jgi:hypothetical protein
MTLAQVDTGPLEQAFTDVARFVPEFLAFLAILVIGYFVAKAIAKVLDKVLERAGFDRAVERGGVKKALARSQYDASSILSKLVFYTLFLFVLQMAFGVFGQNPISELITGVISYLPKVFIAVVIVVVASAIAAGAREVIDVALGGLSYGKMLGTIASVVILAIGVFAALNELEIATAIVNGLFYAMLAIVAGSAVIAIGGGGIMPMRQQWEKALNKVEEEAPRMKEQAQSTSSADLKARAQMRKEQMSGQSDEHTSAATIRLPQEERTRP